MPVAARKNVFWFLWFLDFGGSLGNSGWAGRFLTRLEVGGVGGRRVVLLTGVDGGKSGVSQLKARF